MATNEQAGPALSQAIKADKVAHPQEWEDCTPCRLIGAGAFIGLGAYTFVSGHAQLESNKAEILKTNSRTMFKVRGAGITGTAMMLVGLGIYRFVAD